ncbi:MAG: hypothetical protein M3160_02390 [Candidatus Eremiobacteraeota bacterium]|nr:hypothetical protein [Candidatus Eremiobacteraeota bacterium]
MTAQPAASSARRFLESPIVVVFAICAGFAIVRMATVPGDGDIFWQRWLGSVILATREVPRALGDEVTSAVGSPWVAHEWLFSVAYAWLQMHGLGVIAVVGLAACVMGVLILTALRTLDLGASITSTIAAMVITTLTMMSGLGIRVQIVSWLFVTIFLKLLPQKRVRWILIILTVVWANLHASVVIAPIIIGAYGVGRTLDHRREGLPLALLTILTAAATLATPFGYVLPTYAFSILSNSLIHQLTTEWQAPSVWALLIGLLCIIPIALIPRDRIGSGERLVVLLLFLMMADAVRNMPLFFIGAAPLAAAALPFRSRVLVAESANAVAFGLFVSVGTFVTILLTVHAFGKASAPLPTFAAQYITNLPDTRVFCNDFAWCGMVVGHPGVRVFLDGRADPFPRSVWADYKTIRFESTWNSALRRNGLNTVLVARTDGLTRRLSTSALWVRVYSDRYYEVYRSAMCQRKLWTTPEQWSVDRVGRKLPSQLR